MKVKITNEAKNWITLSELPAVKSIVAAMKDEDLKWYCESAARVAGSNNSWMILNPSATIAKNSRIWDRIEEGSGQLDVWIEFIAFDGLSEFMTVGVYLTDLWEVTGYNNAEIRSHMYVRYE